MNNNNRIKLTFKECQWEVVYSKLPGITKDSPDRVKKKALQSHISSQLNKLFSQCVDMPDSSPCVECKQQISVGLTNSSFKNLDIIAKKTGIEDAGLIVAKFIITPLLV